MVSEGSGLLERLLSQLIKAAIYNQLSGADHLEVNVSTALDQLLQGETSEISIHSKGLWLLPDLRINTLDAVISRLSISLSDAVRGQIALDRPLITSVDVRLDEQGLNRFLNADPMSDWLQSIKFLEQKQAFCLVPQQINCQFKECQLIFDVQAEIQRRCAGTAPIAVAGCLHVAPHSEQDRHKQTLIYLKEAHFKPNRAPLIAETAAILGWLGEMIGRRHIEQPLFSATLRFLRLSGTVLELGIDAQINQLTPLLTYLDI